MKTDYIVVGGGVVGCALAYGLLKTGKTVTVLDGGDGAHRASRGNFGLVWLSNKGINAPHYSAWTRRSVGMWKQLSDELETLTGESLNYQQTGGYDFFFSEEEMNDYEQNYVRLAEQLGEAQPVEKWYRDKLLEEEPLIGPQVAGALYGKEDGHVNPLNLLRAYTAAIQKKGGNLVTGVNVIDIQQDTNGEFCVIGEDGRQFYCDKVLLAAGLGSAKLGPLLGFKAPVKPQKGQVLITEKLAPVLPRPSGIIRQVDEGGIQIGDSKEWAGLDDSDALDVTAAIAERAVAVYPFLADVQLVRSWGALRIVTDDGLPIYQQSQTHPGAFLVTCHSGITLAAAHSYLLPEWLERTPSAPDLELFSEDRF